MNIDCQLIVFLAIEAMTLGLATIWFGGKLLK